MSVAYGVIYASMSAALGGYYPGKRGRLDALVLG